MTSEPITDMNPPSEPPAAQLIERLAEPPCPAEVETRDTDPIPQRPSL
jgi:hypothetical protein